MYSLELDFFEGSAVLFLFLYSNTESQVEKFQRVEDNFAALQAALREIQADNSDKVDISEQVWLGAADIYTLNVKGTIARTVHNTFTNIFLVLK